MRLTAHGSTLNSCVHACAQVLHCSDLLRKGHGQCRFSDCRTLCGRLQREDMPRRLSCGKHTGPWMWKNGKTAGRLDWQLRFLTRPNLACRGSRILPICCWASRFQAIIIAWRFAVLGDFEVDELEGQEGCGPVSTLQTCSDGLTVEHAGTWHQARRIGGASCPPHALAVAEAADGPMWTYEARVIMTVKQLRCNMQQKQNDVSSRGSRAH